jgi:hypothetical protein
MAIVLVAATPPKKADRIVIVKSAPTLTLMSGQVLKSYKVALGGDPGDSRWQNSDSVRLSVGEGRAR